MTPREKVLDVACQIQAMLNGEQSDLLCPFCQQITVEGQMLCCDQAGEIVNAIMDHVEHLERTELIDQIMDHLSHLPSRVILN